MITKARSFSTISFLGESPFNQGRPAAFQRTEIFRFLADSRPIKYRERDISADRKPGKAPPPTTCPATITSASSSPPASIVTSSSDWALTSSSPALLANYHDQSLFLSSPGGFFILSSIYFFHFFLLYVIRVVGDWAHGTGPGENISGSRRHRPMARWRGCMARSAVHPDEFVVRTSGNLAGICTRIRAR